MQIIILVANYLSNNIPTKIWICQYNIHGLEKHENQLIFGESSSSSYRENIEGFKAVHNYNMNILEYTKL